MSVSQKTAPLTDLPVAPGVGNLDGLSTRIDDIIRSDNELCQRIEARVAGQGIELPRLPTTAMEIVQITADPGLELSDLVERIEKDPALSGEVLRFAGSPIMGSRFELTTLNDAVRRLGIKGVRNLIFGLSMKGVIFRDPDLVRYAEEVWRQATTIAAIARRIAPVFGVDPDQAFLLGLMSDIGKVAMMELLRREFEMDAELRARAHTGLVGDAFFLAHEKVGGAMARLWGLSEDLIEVASCHHLFYDNEANPQLAAFASLAHKLDYHLSVGDAEAFRNEAGVSEMTFLRLSEADRQRVLGLAVAAYRSLAAD
ncbi:MAG: HDOD domain-containing protein [Planctomycetes bacterium]|nr:HDOD domain-containing protein [Planctomycetota bacterium]